MLFPFKFYNLIEQNLEFENIQGLGHGVVKIQEFENQSLWQEINSFATRYLPIMSTLPILE